MSIAAPELPHDRRKLTRSPLVNAIWQLKFTSQVSLGDGRAVVEFQEALNRDTALAPAQSEGLALQFSMGQPVADPAATPASAWRLSSSDERASVTLGPGVVTLESSQYGSWEEDYQGWIADIVRALAQVFSPGLQTRVGLRYVNVIFGKVLDRPAFGQLEEFEGYVHASLLGFAHGEFAGDIDMIQGRQVLSFGEVKVNLNHALVSAESSGIGFLVDVDSYLERATIFDQDSVKASSEQLHDIALAVFQRCITPKAWDAMAPIDQD